MNPLSEIDDTMHIFIRASNGVLESGQTTLSLRGETRAEALGHAYHLRDHIQENGYEAECEYVGLSDEQPDWSSEPRHDIIIRYE